MKFKKIILTITTLITSFALCSFTDNSASFDGGEDEFIQNLDVLSPTLDKEYLYGDENFELENELTDEDVAVIGEYISYDETHIELIQTIYEVLPVNDLLLSPTEYTNVTGEEPIYDEINDYSINYKKLSYVECSISLMNYMTDNEYGLINGNGELELYDDEFIQQAPIMNLKLSWFKMTFRTNYIGTVIFGAFGLLINFDSVNNVNKLFNATDDQLSECFRDVANDLILSGASYFGNLMISSLATAVSTTISLLNIVNKATWFGRIKEIVKFMLKFYAPGLLRGIVMILSGILYQYGTDVEIGLWWSNYNVLNYKV